jgi:hypothetical protein
VWVTECDQVQQYASTPTISNQKAAKTKKERFTFSCMCLLPTIGLLTG